MEKECCEEEVQPYRKTDYKVIIYIYIYIYNIYVIFNQLFDYMSHNTLFCHEQFGFCTGHSTVN